MSAVEEEVDDAETSEEEWRKIPGFDLYEVSNKGRVRRIGSRVMKSHTKEDGYVHIKMVPMKGHNQVSKLVHRLVAESFIDNPDNLKEVNHIDHNPGNNDEANLEWTTCEKNRSDRRNNGVINQGLGARRPILQYNAKTGEKIRQFNSGAEALEVLRKGSPQGLCGALSGRRKTFQGFKWEYVKVATIENEIWKGLSPEIVRGIQGYKISSEGRLEDARGNIRAGYQHSSGYLRFCIGNHDYCVHVLVARTFLPNFFGKRIVNHKNGNKKDPRLYNLQWTTDSENILHAHKSGLITSSRPIKQLSLDGTQIIAEHVSLTAAGLATGYDPTKISAAASKHSFSGLYRWEFMDSKDYDYKGRAKAVRQLSLDGEHIHDFPTTNKAATAMKIEQNAFRKSVQKDELIGGFKWVFIN